MTVMTRYWIIAPFDSTMPAIWEKVWQFDLNHSMISVGWRELGNAINLDENELRDLFQETYGHTKIYMFWNFIHNVQVGDVVIARRGRKKIVAIGTVTRQAYYDWDKAVEASSVEYAYPNHIDVNWHDAPRNIEFDHIVFGMQTISEVKEERYRELIGELHNDIEVKTDEGEVEDVREFVLEKYLEEFIISNFSTIFQGKLILYRDPEENVIGQQYTTDVGIIDILAEEPSSNSLVVIELKKGRESDKVVGQILRYMGWVKENLCKDGQGVKGIVICKDSDTRLSYALSMTINIVTKYYQIDFQLTDEPSSK